MGEASAAVEGHRLLSFGTLALMVAYLMLNSSLNLLNKWALGMYGFRFPFLLTCAHMSFNFLTLAPVALREKTEVHVASLRAQYQGLLCIGCFLALNIALNNMSLLDISLSLNQIVRSSIPVVTCLLAIVVERKIPTRKEAVALVILTGGVMLAVWQGSVSGKPYAIFFCCMATLCAGAMVTFSSKLLSEKLDVVRLTFYTAPVSLACLAPFCFIFERQRFLEYLPKHRGATVSIIAVTSLNALAYNLVHVAVIKCTSAVATTVLGEIKIVGLLMLSALLLGEDKEFTPTMTIGCLAAVVGFVLYSHTHLSQEQAIGSKAGGSLPAVGGGVASRQEEESTPLIKVIDEAVAKHRSVDKR